MNECRSSVYMNEHPRSKIGSSKEVVGECKYTSMTVRKMKFISYIYSILRIFSINQSQLEMKQFLINDCFRTSTGFVGCRME